MDPIRINKYLASRLGISRREADKLITQRRVKINGLIANIGAQIKPGVNILVNDKLVPGEVKYVYLLLNKPVNYVCSRKQQGDSPTVYDLLPTKFHSLKTVGRLDRNSSGLILLTNDGDFAYKMTHPKFYKTKVYQVKLSKPLQSQDQQTINDAGVKLPDGPSQLKLESNDNKGLSWTVKMHEGRNRQIRRTFDALGYEVIKLHRTNFAEYALDDIKPGNFIEINP